MYENRYSGFFNPDLEKRLRERGVETIIVVGATTSVCVESTVQRCSLSSCSLRASPRATRSLLRRPLPEQAECLPLGREQRAVGTTTQAPGTGP